MQPQRSTSESWPSKHNEAGAVARRAAGMTTPTPAGTEPIFMDDEEPVPKPMKNLTPTNKRPNAVDSFRETHQTDCKDREEPPDQCRQVDVHNDACPKMKDELDKKRSTIKVTVLESTNGTQTLGWFDPRCRVCSRLESERKKHSRNKKKNDRPRVTKVTKTKKPQPRRTMVNKALSMIFDGRNVGIQNKKAKCSGRSRDVGKRSGMKFSYAGTAVSKTGRSSSTIHSNANKRNPGSESALSVSSYNSFMSMDHEPMC